MMAKFLAAAWLAVLLLVQPVLAQETAPSSEPLKILRVTPESTAGDDAPAGRQITITFDRAMVPIGRMDRTAAEVPVSIQPALNCQWRWLNTSTLSCNLDEKDQLLLATTYRVSVNADVAAQDGAKLGTPYHHQFTTERPAESYTGFRTWKTPGTPVLRVVFNQAVTAASVQQHLYFQASGGGQRVAALVEPEPEQNSASTPVQPAKTAWWVLRFSKPKPPKLDGQDAKRVWLLQPQNPLPLDSAVELKIEPGLAATKGSEPGVENRVVKAFDTYPEFQAIGVACTTNEERKVLIAADGDRDNLDQWKIDGDKPIVVKASQQPDQLCNPQAPLALVFSAPVLRSQIKQHLVVYDDKHFERASLSWEVAGDRLGLGDYHRKGNAHTVMLPINSLKAAGSYNLKVESHRQGFWRRLWSSLTGATPPTDLADEFGRKLAKPFTVSVKMDHRRPNFVIAHPAAVLEQGVESEVPLYVQNLRSTRFAYRKLTTDGAVAEQSSTQTIPAVQDIQFAVPFGVRDLLAGRSGAVYGELSSDPSVSSDPRLFAQVTPYQLHLKLGHFSSLAWVTEMASGRPVAGARVRLYKDSLAKLGVPSDVLAEAVTDEAGVAMLPGTQRLDPKLELIPRYEMDEDEEGGRRLTSEDAPRLFVRVDKGQEMAVMTLSKDFLIDNWRATGSYNPEKKYGHIVTWGTTAQGIYRAGDTIQYKLYVRDQNDQTLVPAPKKGYRLEIRDPTDKVVEQVDNITLSEFGAYSGEFTTAKKAPVGWYQFILKANFDPNAKPKPVTEDAGEGEDASQQDGFEWRPMQVLVSDFTPSAFKVGTDLNGDFFRDGQQVEVTTTAKLHAGGAYGNAQARVTANLELRSFSSPRPELQDFVFDSTNRSDDDQNSVPNSEEIYQKIQDLDGVGELRQAFALANSKILYGKLVVESAVQDDRGKSIAASASADYVGLDRWVGLKNTEWIYNAKKPARLEYVVVDERGQPAAGTAVVIKFERQVISAARVKGAGNAYLTNTSTQWQPAGECQGTSTTQAMACSFTPDQAGDYRAIASIVDSKGRAHSTQIRLWVVGKDYVQWSSEGGKDSDVVLEIRPEKPAYQVGDTARYLIKNPYPGAQALITIERYGVIDRFVQKFDSSTAVVEFPIKPDYLPGFYLSVTVMSPRVPKPLQEQAEASKVGQLDLGKPTFRMGYVTVPVKDPYKEILVTAKPAEPVYRPRDRVQVQLHAAPRFGNGKAEPIELAVVVLDEAVLDLLTGGKNAFDPYTGLYNLQSLDLRNYSLLTRLVGRQKFEKKGANPGGDGGSDLGMRNLFKFVSYWNPSLKTDANGNATISFEAPDNLTGWRVLAMATTPSDRLGLGDASFKVNRPTEVRPVMPNQVTEGDVFQAGFSVMNRTDQPRTLQVEITASGAIDTDKTPAAFSQTVPLEPYQRTTLFMPIQSKTLPLSRDVAQGQLRFVVRAGDAVDTDGIEHLVPVNKRQSLEVAANYDTTTDVQVDEAIAFPDQIRPDVGGISLVVSPSVIANVQGAFDYVRHYPYWCWEQRLTKGVMAAHYQKLKPYIDQGFTWQESASLPDQLLKDAANFQAPNGGMAYWVANDNHADPYLSAYTALAFQWLRQDGYSIPPMVEDKLHGYLRNFLKNNAAPTFYSEGMRSTVRAVALAALAESGKVDKQELERFRPHIPQMSLFGKAHFLQAALKVGGSEALVQEVAKAILAKSVQSGGKFVFNESLDDGYERILASPLRENCAVLDGLTQLANQPGGKELVGDIPFKLVRSITQGRKNRDHWENTQENMFCMNALVNYSRAYESVKPAMTVQASLDSVGFGNTRFEDLRNPPVTFDRPLAAGDVGRKAKLSLEKQGDGRLYYATRLSYAPLEAADSDRNAGIEIHREYSVERNKSWVLLKNPFQIQRGELVRVDLYLSLPTARNFVVVDDPVPGGVEPVNRDLATTSLLDANKGAFQAAGGSFWFKFSDWISYNTVFWSFYHQELRHDSARFYADYLPAGNYHLSYTAQAVAEGEFAVMPVRAEEMYDPDVYGRGSSERLLVGKPAP